MPARSGFLESIQSLRGIATLAVLGAHAAFISGLAASGSPALPYASRFEVAVTLFFMISGFVLYRPYVRARLRATDPPDLLRYASARILRIIPAYWVALAVIVAWLGLNGVFTPKGVITYFGFLQVYDADTFNGGLPQAWTLCIEALFYVLLPVYAWALRRVQRSTLGERVRDEWIGIAALFAVGVLWNAVFLAANTPSRSVFPLLFSFPAFVDQLALGMGLAVLAVWVEARPRERRWHGVIDRWPAIGIGVSLVAFWAVATQIGLEGGVEPISQVQWGLRHALFSICALGLMVPAIFGVQERGLTRRFLNFRPLAWVGDVSYGIYLWHLAVLIQIKRWGFDPPFSATVNWVVWCLLAAVPTFLLAAGSWYLIERPALALRSLLPGRPQPRALDADVEAGFGSTAPETAASAAGAAERA